MITIDVPENKCLACSEPFDAATHMFGRETPEPGDVSICISCGHIMAFNIDLTMRELTSQEMYEVAGDPRIIKLQEARGAVMKKEKQ